MTQFDWSYRPLAYFTMPIPAMISTFRQEYARLRAELTLRPSDPGVAAFLHDHPWMEHPLDQPSEAEQQLLESYDPQFMSGAYLPPLENWEVEICRLRMDSVTGDVISWRPKPSDGGIEITCTDEYYDVGDTVFEFTPASTDTPLSFEEVVLLIASTDLVDIDGAVPVTCLGKTFDAYPEFLRFSSAYYRDLGHAMRTLLAEC